MEKKQKVYILTSGSYSDYQIECVCSTKQMAKKLKAINAWQIEEYVIDERINDFKKAEELLEKGYKNYFVRMTESGKVTQIVNGKNCWISMFDIIKSKRDKTDFEFDFEGDLYGCILAKNDEQAIKIINDKRAFLIANNQWGRK